MSSPYPRGRHWAPPSWPGWRPGSSSRWPTAPGGRDTPTGSSPTRRGPGLSPSVTDGSASWRETPVPIEIRIDRDKCMGSGNCSFWAPGTFDLDEEGISIVTDPEGDPEEKVVLA